VRIFQVQAAGLQAEFPPLRTVPGGAAAATRTLPRDLASFTGRGRELAELEELAAAARSEQVLPLLPGSGGSLVLVTSRRHLSGLEDATTVSLDILPPEEAAGWPRRGTGWS
jgi:hypothetical protein